MSKRSQAKERKEKRSEQQSKKQRTQLIGVGAIVLVLIAAGLYFGFFAPGKTLDVTERMLLDPVLGNPDAPVTLEEWGAYGCESCKQVHEQGILEAILAEYPGQIRIVFRDFPVIMPTYDRAAAEVAQCAFDQGNEAFWQVHDWLYSEATQGRTNQSQIIEAAGGLGLNVDELRSCVRSNIHERTVAFDEQRGYELGINGTPTFFVNGQRMLGFQQLVDTIEAEIAKASQ